MTLKALYDETVKLSKDERLHEDTRWHLHNAARSIILAIQTQDRKAVVAKCSPPERK